MVQEELIQLGEEVAIMFRIYATKVITRTVKLFLFSIATLITKWIVQLTVCICVWNEQNRTSIEQMNGTTLLSAFKYHKSTLLGVVFNSGCSAAYILLYVPVV